MKIQITLLLFILNLSVHLTAQKQIGSVASNAFQNMVDKNYTAAVQNFGYLIKAPHYTQLEQVNKKGKTARTKALAVFHYNYATALAFSGKYEEGLASLTAMEKSSKKPAFFSFLKDIYRDRFFDNSASYKNFEEAYKAFDDFPNIAYDVAPALAARGLYEKAAAIYTKALKKDKSGINYYNIGLINKKMGQETAAKKFFEKGLAAFPTKKNPDNCSYQSIHILLLYELGQSEAAKKLASEILQNNPDDFCAIENLAKLKFLTKDYEQAIADYQELVTNNPYYENGFLSIIQSYKALGQTERALTMLNDLIEIYPNYAMALTERATILGQKGMADEAKTDINKAIKLMPNHSMIQKVNNDLITKQ